MALALTGSVGLVQNSLVSASSIGSLHPVKLPAVSTGKRFSSSRVSKPSQLSVHAVLSESPLSPTTNEQGKAAAEAIGFGGLHHVGLLCANTQKALDFYCGVLGLELNDDRKNVSLPYGGAWLWVGNEMIHLMELPNPDPVTGRPAHGGRDRHACFTINSVEALRQTLDKAGISYTMSKSGRPALFTRDPDGNALEFQQIQK